MAGTENLTKDVTKVIPSEEIIQYLHPSLLHLDYTDRTVQYSITGLTFMFYLILFGSFILACGKSRLFAHLTFKHRVFMSLAVCRGVFGVSGTVLGGYTLFKETNIDRDVVFGNSATSHFTMNTSLGFFAFEVIAVVVSDIAFKTFSKMLLTHHLFALMCYILSVGTGTTHHFGMRGLALEMSTPFSCFCFILLKAKLERSKLWKINQLVLIHTFHLRNVLQCYMWYVTFWNREHIWNFMPKSMFITFYTCLILLTFVMTPYWGHKKTQQYFNPVDWNFQESKTKSTVVNQHTKKTS